MYNSHPIDSEYFDFNDFVESNFDIIKKMFKQSINFIKKSSNNKENMNSRAYIVCIAVYNNLTEINEENFEDILPIEENHEEKMISFFDGILPICTLFDLEEEGSVKFSGQKVELTNYGKKSTERIKKRIKA